jgi:hypothetical protein
LRSSVGEGRGYGLQSRLAVERYVSIVGVHLGFLVPFLADEVVASRGVAPPGLLARRTWLPPR